MPRLGHKKSRLGCRQCKARHVKCDELKPCTNCSRHGVPCSLVTWDPNTPHSHPATSSSASSSAPKHPREGSEDALKPTITSTPSPSVHVDHISHPSTASREESAPAMSEGSSPSSQSDHFPFLTRFIHQPEKNESDLWLRDLELMHHWTIEAFDELSQRDDMRHVWRIEAPQHAVNHAFLMHEMLAFSALHKAHKLPGKRAQYYSFGIHHQDLTIRGIREKLRNVTPHEAPAIVATSTLLTLSVFASTGFELNYPEIANSQSAIDGILNIFNLMQGMGNVLALAQVHVVNSFIAPMFKDSTEAIPSQPMLQELLQRLPALSAFIQSRPDLPEQERMTYLTAVASFEPVLQMSMAPCVDNREFHFLFLWPMYLQPDFLNLLRQRHSGALAIAMHYSTMLFASQSRYWLMEGWGEQLMRACLDKLNQDWHSACQWPITFIKSNPTWDIFSNLVQLRHGPSIPLQPPEATTFTYSHRKPAEVPLRKQAVIPPVPGGQSTDPIPGPYLQSDATARPVYDPRATSAPWTKRPESAEHGD